MNDLLRLREAIVASLQQSLGAGVNVDAHGGTFDLEEIKRYATLAPAVRVAAVGAGRASRFSDGRWKVPVHFAAVIIARDAAAPAKISRDFAALILASAVELAVASNRFGLEGVMQPQAVEGRNEYSGKVDQFGVAIWQVTWTSEVLIGAPGDPANAAVTSLVQALVNGDSYWTAAAGLTGVDPLNPADQP